MSGQQVYVHDRLKGTTVLVSADSAGKKANDDCDRPAISANGRFVVFRSIAGNLVPNDVNGGTDVFVRDMKKGKTVRASVDSGGNPFTAGGCGRPAISANGRFVAFSSTATTLAPGDANGSMDDVFVHDRKKGTTVRVSVASTGIGGGAASKDASISANGRFVAFTSDATNLVPNDTNSAADVFVHDRKKGVTTRVSVDSQGNQGGAASADSAISANGELVVFQSLATNLVPFDTNGVGDVFVHDEIE